MTTVICGNTDVPVQASTCRRSACRTPSTARRAPSACPRVSACQTATTPSPPGPTHNTTWNVSRSEPQINTHKPTNFLMHKIWFYIFWTTVPSKLPESTRIRCNVFWLFLKKSLFKIKALLVWLKNYDNINNLNVFLHTYPYMVQWLTILSTYFWSLPYVFQAPFLVCPYFLRVCCCC